MDKNFLLTFGIILFPNGKLVKLYIAKYKSVTSVTDNSLNRHQENVLAAKLLSIIHSRFYFLLGLPH